MTQRKEGAKRGRPPNPRWAALALLTRPGTRLTAQEVADALHIGRASFLTAYCWNKTCPIPAPFRLVRDGGSLLIERT